MSYNENLVAMRIAWQAYRAAKTEKERKETARLITYYNKRYEKEKLKKKNVFGFAGFRLKNIKF